ncbi:hypothetical protein D9757_003017 [Collybiopsis confluens]|uniref:Uncharacterized protein n=1 Tax=Collybiopsis confluens TaxID=2823264 RepID=A0A8H5HY08_9AGAR|nr:hypothetical protein D9757_003017 [Collybiopsis confluens]
MHLHSHSHGQIVHHAEVLAQAYLPSSPSPVPSLNQAILLPVPFAVPQIRFQEGDESTFARGHSPALAEVCLDQKLLLNFIDGLNLAMAVNPPLRIVGTSGPVVGYVPFNWAQLPNASVHTDSRTGSRSLSKSIADHYLRTANINLFKPRGLAVRICTTSAMLVLATPPEPDVPTIQKVGRGALTVARYLPITGLAVRGVMRAMEKSKASDDLNKPIGQRRLALMKGRTLPLSTGGSPPQVTKSVSKMLSHYKVSLDGTQTEEKDWKQERSKERFEQVGVTSNSPGGGGLDHSLSKGARAIERAERRRRQIGGLGRQVKLALPKGPEGDLLRDWATDELLWVVIISDAKDATIEDIIKAEDPANEEHVGHKVWMGEMIYESEEIADDMS